MNVSLKQLFPPQEISLKPFLQHAAYHAELDGARTEDSTSFLEKVADQAQKFEGEGMESVRNSVELASHFRVNKQDQHDLARALRKAGLNSPEMIRGVIAAVAIGALSDGVVASVQAVNSADQGLPGILPEKESSLRSFMNGELRGSTWSNPDEFYQHLDKQLTSEMGQHPGESLMRGAKFGAAIRVNRTELGHVAKKLGQSYQKGKIIRFALGAIAVGTLASVGERVEGLLLGFDNHQQLTNQAYL